MASELEPVSFLLLFAGILVLFAAIWIFVISLMSLISGWGKLAARYQTDASFTGSVWRWQSGSMGLVGIQNCLTIGADRRGLYLAMMALFRFRHPPLFIPWSEITVTPKRVFFGSGMQFRMGPAPGVPLWVSTGLAEKLRQASL